MHWLHTGYTSCAFTPSGRELSSARFASSKLVGKGSNGGKESVHENPHGTFTKRWVTLKHKIQFL